MLKAIIIVLFFILLVIPIVLGIALLSGAIIGAGFYLVWNFFVSPVFVLPAVTFFWQSIAVGTGLVLLSSVLSLRFKATKE